MGSLAVKSISVASHLILYDYAMITYFVNASILVSYTRGGWVVGLSHFTVMKNIFVTEFSKFSENIYGKLKWVS